jgi:hypothetical protein
MAEKTGAAMTSNRAVTVFGAYGHTGRFVVAELCRRGWAPILSGRDTDSRWNCASHRPRIRLRWIAPSTAP